MEYTVKAGDTVAKLANTYKTTVSAIAKANPAITNVNFIRVGQKIEIPMASSASVPAIAVTQAPAPVKAGFDFAGIFSDKKKLLFTVVGLAAVAAFFMRKKRV